MISTLQARKTRILQVQLNDKHSTAECRDALILHDWSLDDAREYLQQKKQREW